MEGYSRRKNYTIDNPKPVALLQVVPPLNGNFQNVIKVFNGTRNALDQDIWLVGLEYSDNGLKYVT